MPGSPIPPRRRPAPASGATPRWRHARVQLRFVRQEIVEVLWLPLSQKSTTRAHRPIAATRTQSDEQVGLGPIEPEWPVSAPPSTGGRTDENSKPPGKLSL